MCADMEPSVDIYRGRGELARALAARVAVLAAEALLARERFRLAIPGGSVVSLLAQGAAEHELDTARWEIFWTDERCVPQDDPQSNFHAAQAEWFGPLGVPRHRLHPANGALGPEAAANAYAADLARVFGADAEPWPRLDLVLLGIGEDGHVASLFPGDPALEEARCWVVPVFHAPKPPSERISLSLPVLNHARHLLVVAAGEGKANALSRVWAPDATAAPLPAQRLQPVDGDLRWMLDPAAGASYPPAGSRSTPPVKDPP